MRYQLRPWTCGPASVRNALRCFGHKVSELKIRQYTNTTQEEGTSEEGVLNAIRKLGYTASEFHNDSNQEAWEWLLENLAEGNPVILCLDAWQHWATAVGVLGNRVVLVDSSDLRNNKAENGVCLLSKKELLWRWRYSRKGPVECRLYAIAVKRS